MNSEGDFIELPWDIISEDIEIHFNLTFSDPGVELKWTGDGKWLKISWFL